MKPVYCNGKPAESLTMQQFSLNGTSNTCQMSFQGIALSTEPCRGRLCHHLPQFSFLLRIRLRAKCQVDKVSVVNKQKRSNPNVSHKD